MTAVVNALNAVNVRKTIIVNIAFPRRPIPLFQQLTAFLSCSAPSLLSWDSLWPFTGLTPRWRAGAAAGGPRRVARARGRLQLRGLPDRPVFSTCWWLVACVRILFFVVPGLWHSIS